MGADPPNPKTPGAQGMDRIDHETTLCTGGQYPVLRAPIPHKTMYRRALEIRAMLAFHHWKSGAMMPPEARDTVSALTTPNTPKLASSQARKPPYLIESTAL